MASLEADEDDRQEMSEVAEFMEWLTCGGVTSSNFDCLRVLVVSNEDDDLGSSFNRIPPTSIGGVGCSHLDGSARGDRATHY